MITLLGIFTVAVVSVGLASADCDDTTTSKIQQCLFASELFNPTSAPTDEKSIETFCKQNMNSVVDCMEVHVNECADDPKERKLMNLLVDLDATRQGLVYMCNNVTVLRNKLTCFSVFSQSSFVDCLQDAVGTIANSGQPSDLKSGLDTVCRFFDAFTTCFTDPFQGDCSVVGTIYQRLFEGLKYPYCKMNNMKREAAIRDYETTVAGCSITRYSLLSLISLLITVYLL